MKTFKDFDKDLLSSGILTEEEQARYIEVCSFCGKPAGPNSVKRLIYERPKRKDHIFCSEEHAFFYQMGAEG
jgi:hypothetical protein